VFVTNFPPGFGGLPVVEAVGGSIAAFVAGVVASAAVVVCSSVATQKLIVEPKLQEQAGANIVATRNLIADGTPEELRAAIAALKSTPDRLDPLKRVLYDLNADGVKVHTESLISAMERALADGEAKTDQTVRALDAVRLEQTNTKDALSGQLERHRAREAQAEDTNVARLREIASLTGDASEATRAASAKARQERDNQTRSVVEASARVRSATTDAASRTASAMELAAARIVAAIFAARPVIQSTTVVNQTTVQNRYTQPPSRYRGNERL
jgi:hypothetical protein